MCRDKLFRDQEVEFLTTDGQEDPPVSVRRAVELVQLLDNASRFYLRCEQFLWDIGMERTSLK